MSVCRSVSVYRSMSACRFKVAFVALGLSIGGSAMVHAGQTAAELAPVAAAPAQRQPADLAGTWDIAVDNKGASCRLLLRPQQAFNGDYFVGIPPACRHTIPELAKVGHWGMPDAAHLKLASTSGITVLFFAAKGDSYATTAGDHSFTLKQIASAGRSAAGFAPVEASPAPGFTDIVPISKRSKAVDVEETPNDLGGRYAVLREKRDTGCMITLDDKSRVKGGARAQLAPGCRDQGIVIFDPASWQIVKGQLVLTARAGHKTHLEKSGVDSWQKDPKDGGKPLGLKKL